LGFSHQNRGGSAEDPAKILLSRDVRGLLTLHLAASVLGNEPQVLHVQMHKSVKTIVLRGEQTTFQLDFDLSAPVKAIVFGGITPKSPSELVISADIRRLGFAVDRLDCVSEKSNRVELSHGGAAF
jgi:hypothetical protein